MDGSTGGRRVCKDGHRMDGFDIHTVNCHEWFDRTAGSAIGEFRRAPDGPSENGVPDNHVSVGVFSPEGDERGRYLDGKSNFMLPPGIRVLQK